MNETGYYVLSQNQLHYTSFRENIGVNAWKYEAYNNLVKVKDQVYISKFIATREHIGENWIFLYSIFEPSEPLGFVFSRNSFSTSYLTLYDQTLEEISTISGNGVYKNQNNELFLNTVSGVKKLNILLSKDISAIEKQTGTNFGPNGYLSLTLTNNFPSSNILFAHKVSENNIEFGKIEKYSDHEVKLGIGLASLSPFIALSIEDLEQKPVVSITSKTEPEETLPKVEEVDKGEKDDSPKTGTFELINYISVITLMSAVGIIILKKKKI